MNTKESVNFSLFIILLHFIFVIFQLFRSECCLEQTAVEFYSQKRPNSSIVWSKFTFSKF